MKRAYFVLLSLTVSFAATAASGAVKYFREYPDSDCPVLIKKYKNFSIWNNGNSRIAVEADSACAGRPGRALELKNVQLTIESGQTRIARLFSPTGIISQRQGRLIMGEIYGPTESALFPATPTLLVDFNDNSVRSPTGTYFDFSK